MLKIHVLVRVAICYLFVFLPLHSMDEWFYDRFFRLRGRRSSETSYVLVRVNSTNLSESIERENIHYPKAATSAPPIWFHNYYTLLLDKILKDEPKAVIFTSYFEALDDPTVPQMYHPAVIFSAYLNDENKLVLPPQQLSHGDNYGFNNIFPDPDNTVRRANLVYSSATSLALRGYGRVTDGAVNRDLLEPLAIDFRGPVGSYPSLDAKNIIDGAAPPGFFKEKIVLIGRENSRTVDNETPVGKMPKLEIHANILDTFLSGREIIAAPGWVIYVVAALAVTASVLIIIYFPLGVAWLFLLLEALLFFLTALGLFSFSKVWVGIANPIFCIFATHLLMLGYKLGRQEEEQWKIQQEAEYLKSMDQFKNNFISLFSHDLKTPIAKIKAITDRLLTEHPDLPDNVKVSLKGLDRTNGELARLISDILKVTKMESMRLEPSQEVIDLNRLVEEAVQRLKFLADEKQIEIVQDLEPLFSMEGDTQLIQEVITNLLENAIKYSPEKRRIIIRTEEQDNRVRVAVIDQGNGIPPDELPRVTGKFYRGKSVVNTTKGSGLGLYLSKYFVELHHGELHLESELGRGTTVAFWLPLSS